MPMPTSGTWPPQHMAPAYHAYQQWDAWYGGIPETLMRVYGQYRDAPPTQRVRPGQYAGGLIGTLSRWLWGTPPPPTSRDLRLHVPLPADIASISAALLFSEPPKLIADQPLAQDRLNMFIEDGLWVTLRHAAESASVLGDVYLRPVIDRDVAPDRAIISVVHADGAIPIFRWGRLVEITFWSQLPTDNNGICLRLLEHHSVENIGGRRVGRITYALYQGTATELGRPIPLTEHPYSAPLAEVVDEQSGQDTGLDRLDVVRIPNAGPQRRWRKFGDLRYLGRSDLDGNEQIFDKIDEVWTSWMADIRLGRARIIIPAHMLENLGPGQGAVWDPDREVYSAVNAAPTQNIGLTVSQFSIRWQEHKATIDALVETAMRHSGFSNQTLGEEGDVAMTATEAIARERLTYITRGDRIATWQPALAEYIELHMAVEQINGLGNGVDPVRPVIEWPDAVSESLETQARTVQMLRSAEVISIETGIRMLHPDWGDEQVADEMRRIVADRSAGVTGASDPLATGNAFAAADLSEAPADSLE